MDSIKFLLPFLFRLAIISFSAAIVWWVIITFFPDARLHSLFSVTSTSTSEAAQEGWLPSPKSYKGLLGKAKTPGENDNIYVPGQAYNGYGNAYNGNIGGADVNFITYTSTGTQITHNGVVVSTIGNQPQGAPDQQAQQSAQQTSTSNGYAQKNLFIRNLSIYEKGHVYTGLSFVGEARESMFKDGKFLIIIADRTGHAVLVASAEATTNWTVPGWVKFRTKINGALPVNAPCTMVFESAMHTYANSNQPSQPIRVAIPVICN